MSTADTAKTDQCSICLDSPPYSECPGRGCCAFIVAGLKEEAAAALERQQADFDLRSDAQYFRWLEYNMRVMSADQVYVTHFIRVPVAMSFRESIDAAMKGDA